MLEAKPKRLTERVELRFPQMKAASQAMYRQTNAEYNRFCAARAGESVLNK